MRCKEGIAVLGLLASWDLAHAGGGAGVGITSPPCGFNAPPLSACTYPSTDCEPNHPNYILADLTFNDRINLDLDLLYSQSFQEFASRDAAHPGWPVTPQERQDLANQFDGYDNPTNPLGPDYQGKWDLQLVFDYYTHGSGLYGGFGPNSNFRFDNTFGGQLESERNHVDVYLVPKFEFVDNAGCVSSIPNGGYGCCEVHSGKAPAEFSDDDEDPPFPEQCPGTAEFTDNSLQVWDHWGNFGNVPNWPQATAVTFDHEFEHVIQNDRFGVEQEPGMLEFFASTAEYLGDPVYPPGTGGLTDDICYDNTVADPSSKPVANYQIWRSWGVYLLQHFRAGSGIADDLIRLWNRTPTRRFNSLPGLLESSGFDGLGCTTCLTGFKGQYRIQELNNRIGVARWVDNPDFGSGVPPSGQGRWGYSLGFDPGNDLGLFRKIATAGAHCDFSHTLPPIYQLGSANLNVNTSVSCYIHPQDPAPCPPSSAQNPGCAPRTVGTFDSPFCYKPSPYCMESQGCGDPIDLYPWAADVVGFVAAPFFTNGNYHELLTTFNFVGIPSGTDCDNQLLEEAYCSYRYFINVVTYNANDTTTDLWDRGENLTSITTYGPYLASSPREIQFIVGDFGCDLIKSVAFVITLADSVATAVAPKPWEFYKRLDYSYSYMVRSPNPGPGYVCPSADPLCPFLYVEGSGGVLMDNNVLGEAAWHEGEVPPDPDVVDHYVLTRPVQLRDGRVHLEIREQGNERTQLDAVRLVAYDVPEGMELARLAGSRVGLVSIRTQSFNVVDRNGRDVTSHLTHLDGDVIEMDTDDYIEFDWVKTESVGPEFIAVHPLLKAPPGGSESLVGSNRGGIQLQAQTRGGWTDVVEFVPRERGERQCVFASEIPGGIGETIRLRLVWMGRHQLDWIGTGSWSEAEGTTLALAEAVHSLRGDIRSELLDVDGVRESLDASESLALSFTGYAPVARRKLCLMTTGHYVIPRAFAGGQWPGAHIQVSDRVGNVEHSLVKVAAYPNPMRRSATFQLDLPASERLEVSVFAVDGHLVRRLYGGAMNAGVNRLEWDGRSEVGIPVPSGQYYYQVQSGSWSKSGKLFVIK